MEEQQEFQIAIALAIILNGDKYSTILDVDLEEDNQWNRCGLVSCQLSARERMYAKISGMIAELAMSQANKTDRDFHTVLEETEFKISVKLANILAKTIHPALEVLKKVVINDHGEHVCGICQDQMKAEDDVRAMGCKHPFHCECIYKWLNKKMVCPLCRYCPMIEDCNKAFT